MATLIDDDVWFCVCCTIAHANGGSCDCPDHEAEVTAGFERLYNDGATVASNSGSDDDEDSGEQEFSWSPCECCLSRLGGSRHRHALFARTSR